MRQRRAVVVGAGVAGLASALALSKVGWRVAVLESRERLQKRPVLLFLWESGVKALRQLGIDARLDLGARAPDRVTIRDQAGADVGSLALAPADPESVRPVYVRQDRLFEALVAKLGPSVDLVHSTTVSRVDLVRLAAGDRTRRWDADFVVAADGTGSTIRSLLEPRSKAVDAGAVAFNAVLPPHRAPRREGDSAEIHGAHGRRFSYADLGENGAAWMAIVPGGLRPESAQIQHELLNRWFSGWPDPVAAYLGATRPEDLVQSLVRTVDPLPTGLHHKSGDGGHLLMVGDSASGTAPVFPVGATVALEDAATLGWALHQAPEDMDAAMDHYRMQRRGRLQALHRFGRRHLKLSSRKRNLITSLVRATPDAWLERYVRNLSRWELPDDMWWVDYA
ncbi:FAD-dependent oxidoreductase [Salininema proteolyticum]|uniref:FAD-dependent oxidoreductase n=1 Tax=Salininema proteolyticum TaxID=1607685 RepID=A0ABV8TYP0_9ACTN